MFGVTSVRTKELCGIINVEMPKCCKEMHLPLIRLPIGLSDLEKVRLFMMRVTSPRRCIACGKVA